MANSDGASLGNHSGNGGSSPGIKSQKSEEEEDRISAFPDCLIQHILSFLPSTKESIRTGILSKRWRNQWTRVPVLVFSSTGKPNKTFPQFIDRTLMLHDCSKIKKFEIRFDSQLCSDPQMTSKIRFAVTKQVEELILHLFLLEDENGLVEFEDSYVLPNFLFNNASLVKLELVRFAFRDNVSANWPNLKELRLDCSYLPGFRFKIILPGCPLLELMEVTEFLCDRDVLASKSLRKLSFIDIQFDSIEAHIEILCPNLEDLSLKVVQNRSYPPNRLSGKTIDFVLSSSPILHTLELAGLYFSGQLVIASKSLKNLVLGRIDGISDLEISCPCLEVSNLYHFEPSISGSMTNLDGECLALKILRQLQHVRLLEIGSWLIQALEAEGSSSLCLNCKYLTVDGTDFDQCLPGILCAIRCSPQLEKLDIKFPLHQFKNTVASQSLLNDWGDENSSKSDGVAFNCLVPNLKTVRIIGFSEELDNCKLVFNFVEFLLKNGKALEKIVVFILADCGKRFVSEVSKKLLSLPRYYPYPNIELCSMCPNV